MFFIAFFFCLISSGRHRISHHRSKRNKNDRLGNYIAKAAMDQINSDYEMEKSHKDTNDANTGYVNMNPGAFDNSECQCYPCQAAMSPLQVTEMQNLQNKIYAQQAQLAQMTSLANKVTEQFKQQAGKNMATRRSAASGDFDEDEDEDEGGDEDEEEGEEDENADSVFSKNELKRLAKIINKERDSLNKQRRSHISMSRQHHRNR
ncbi:hypothetical protein TRFO_38341 [Tritrichomonas foetus]|uniref:Uncharacterized protein n=1 Tax=Tritrichomonas foetus TaxID=1144522 RepID=A0A1J4JBA9_9EUKA|nr:hypothetical protein TRFO_38341 [Tritrichomonas foetus]|eukprot:OHS95527.1 hypothetical protein TRFO_38341 [Tritrichomonas foetus]